MEDFMQRREFIGHLGKGAAAVAILGTSVELAGCNVISDIQAWIPVGETALNSILSVLTANNIIISPAISTIVGLIETGFNDLVAAIQEYQSTTPPPVGVVAKIQAAIQAVADQFANFVSQLSGTAGKILTVVVAMAKVVISTIEGFVNQLPASARALAVRLTPELSTPPIHRTRRAFKKSWNAELDAASKVGVVCPKAAYLSVSFFEHF
jgi:phage-related protein